MPNCWTRASSFPRKRNVKIFKQVLSKECLLLNIWCKTLWSVFTGSTSKVCHLSRCLPSLKCPQIQHIACLLLYQLLRLSGVIHLGLQAVSHDGKPQTWLIFKFKNFDVYHVCSVSPTAINFVGFRIGMFDRTLNYLKVDHIGLWASKQEKVTLFWQSIFRSLLCKHFTWP